MHRKNRFSSSSIPPASITTPTLRNRNSAPQAGFYNDGMLEHDGHRHLGITQVQHQIGGTHGAVVQLLFGHFYACFFQQLTVAVSLVLQALLEHPGVQVQGGGHALDTALSAG